MKFLRLILILITFPTFAQVLSPNAKVSLLTISPGEELYSTFGHSAIRISDPAQMIDVNYNYGTFNFYEPGFYVKFLRGYLNYMISSHPSYVEMEYWNRENRLITEQVLNLSPSQKQKLFEYLENNLQPQNKYYRYKFFTDNCSTRLRDVLNEICGDSLIFDNKLNANHSYRYWIDKYAHNNSQEWADFGMDLAIGFGADKETGFGDAMFIPDNLMLALDKATIKTDSGVFPIVLAKYDLNAIQKKQDASVITPKLFFGVILLFVVGLTFYQNRKKCNNIVFDKIWFTITGIGGWILIGLWFGTDHGVTESNYNLIWVSPLVMPAIYFVKSKSWAVSLFKLFIIILGVGAILVPLVLGTIWNIPTILVMIISLIRGLYVLKIS